MATISPSLGSPKIVQPSVEALNAAVIREMITGEKLRRTIDEEKREQAAARDAAARRGHKTVKGLGRCVLSIPQQEFFTVAEKMGTFDCWSDKGFIRDMQKRYPHLKVSSI